MDVPDFQSVGAWTLGLEQKMSDLSSRPDSCCEARKQTRRVVERDVVEGGNLESVS